MKSQETQPIAESVEMGMMGRFGACDGSHGHPYESTKPVQPLEEDISFSVTIPEDN